MGKTLKLRVRDREDSKSSSVNICSYVSWGVSIVIIIAYSFELGSILFVLSGLVNVINRLVNKYDADLIISSETFVYCKKDVKQSYSTNDISSITLRYASKKERTTFDHEITLEYDGELLKFYTYLDERKMIIFWSVINEIKSMRPDFYTDIISE